MICRICGKEIDDDAKFCPHCGTKTIAENAAEVAEKAVEDAADAAKGAKEAAAIEAAAVIQAAENDAAAKVDDEAAKAAEEGAAKIADKAEALAAAYDADFADDAGLTAGYVKEKTAEELAAEAAADAAQAAEEKKFSDKAPILSAAYESDFAEDAAVDSGGAAAAAIVHEAAAAADAAEDAAADAVAADNADAAEEAAAAVAAAEAVPEEPKKKKKILPIILALVLVAAAIGGYFIYQGLPSTKSGKIVSQALAKLENKDYSGCYNDLRSAYEIAPDNQKVLDAHDKFYAELAQVQFDNKKYSNAISVYLSAAKDIEPSKDKYLEKAAEYCKKTAEVFMKDASAAEIGQLITILNQATNEYSVPGLGPTIAELEKRAAYLEEQAMLGSWGNQILSQYKEGKTDLIVSNYMLNMISASDFYKKVLADKGKVESNYPVIGEIDGTRKIAIYYKNRNYQVYVGEMDASNKRSGEGIWIAYQQGASGTYRSYVVNSEWKDDKPNGKFTNHIFTKFVDGSEAKDLSGNVTKGMYDGEITYDYGDGDVFVTTYENGDPVVIETNSKGQQIYAYNQDRSKILLNLNKNDGIYGTY